MIKFGWPPDWLEHQSLEDAAFWYQQTVLYQEKLNEAYEQQHNEQERSK